MTTYIPASSRIHSVKGEADGKPSYDFTVLSQDWDGATAISLYTKYAGTKNGATVNLWNEWPVLTTAASVPTSSDDTAIAVIPGTGVVLQIYYANGAVQI